MTFPTVPTTAAGRVVGLNQLNTTATLTGPNLNTLTKSPGDLLIAVAGEYQSTATTGAAYTGWAGGGLTWTEIADGGASGTGNGRLGVAVARVVTGSETGTVTVTRSGTLTGDASMIVLCVPGAHATTNPEVTAQASANAAAADPAALSPSWGAEDTLWVGVNGNGMTSGTGSWTANNGAPTNYTDFFGTNPADTSTVGDFGLAVAFRQLNASSEDVGTFSQDTTNARSDALLIAVRPAAVTITSGPALQPRSQPAGGRVFVARPGHVQASLIPLALATLITGSAALTGAGTVSAQVTQPAAASLTGAGALAAQVTQPAGATLAGAGSLSATSGSAAQGSATLTGAGTLSASGTSAASEGPPLVQLRQPAGVRLSMLRTGTAQFSPAAPTAVTTISGTATLTGVGSLSAVTGAITAGPPLSTVRQPAGGRVTTVRAGHVQASLVISSAVTTVDGTAALTGAGALTAVGTVIVTGTAALTGAGTLAANVGGVVTGTAALTGAGALAATVTQAAGATLTGAGTLSASVGGLTTGTAALVGAGTVSAAPTLIVQGTATLTGAGTVAATVTQAVKATLTGAGSLTAFSGSASQGTATMAGAGALSASATVLVPGAATLAGAGTVAAAAVQRINATATLTGAGSLAAVPAQRILAVAALTGAGTLTGLGGFVVFGVAALTGDGALLVIITSIGSLRSTSTARSSMRPSSTPSASMRPGSVAIPISPA